MRKSIYRINLQNLKLNYLIAKNITTGKLFAIVKANAYGHGLEQISQSLEDTVDGFATAFVDEAIKLRQHGIKKNILVLEGFFDKEDLNAIIENDLFTTIHNDYQLKLINNINKTLTLFVKINSGMNRLGFCYENAKQIISKLRRHKLIITTHFACSDNDIQKLNQFLISLKKIFLITKSAHRIQLLFLTTYQAILTVWV